MAKLMQTTSTGVKQAQLYWTEESPTANFLFRSTLRGKQQNPAEYVVGNVRAVSGGVEYSITRKYTYRGATSKVRASITGYALQLDVPDGSLWRNSARTRSESITERRGGISFTPAILFTPTRLASSVVRGYHIVSLLYTGSG